MHNDNIIIIVMRERECVTASVYIATLRKVYVHVQTGPERRIPYSNQNRVREFGGLEWWSGLLEWSTGLDYWSATPTSRYNLALSVIA